MGGEGEGRCMISPSDWAMSGWRVVGWTDGAANLALEPTTDPELIDKFFAKFDHVQPGVAMPPDRVACIAPVETRAAWNMRTTSWGDGRTIIRLFTFDPSARVELSTTSRRSEHVRLASHGMVLPIPPARLLPKCAPLAWVDRTPAVRAPRELINDFVVNLH
jgi:hypothetical protein